MLKRILIVLSVIVIILVCIIIYQQMTADEIDPPGRKNYVILPDGSRMKYKTTCIDFVEYIVTQKGGITPHLRNSDSEPYVCNYINNGETYVPK